MRTLEIQKKNYSHKIYRLHILHIVEIKLCWEIGICCDLKMCYFSFLPDFDFSSFGGSMFIGFTYMFIPLGLALELIEDREVGNKHCNSYPVLTWIVLASYSHCFMQVRSSYLISDPRQESTSCEWPWVWSLLLLLLHCSGRNVSRFVRCSTYSHSGKKKNFPFIRFSRMNRARTSGTYVCTYVNVYTAKQSLF